RGVSDASRLLAEILLDQYRPDEASDELDRWETALRKKRNAEIPDALGELQQRALTMRNMMERVEQIEIIDSLTVDAADFFRHYRLSPEAGRLNRGADLGLNNASIVFSPQCGREIIWAQQHNGADSYALMQAGILDDGSLENAVPMEIEMDAEAMSYPFLMPDGMTLYFAATGPESLGGYDIFMTRRSEQGNGYLKPQNVGMPYNSPANDYMLAIDEATGIGWWATDRNAPEGKLTIYEFVPSQRRVNVDPDAPDLADRARITSIAGTQIPNKDYNSLRRKVAEQSRVTTTGPDKDADKLLLTLQDGSVITSASQLRSQEARRAAERLISVEVELAAISSDLDSLREKYRSGNKSVAARIKGLETELEKARSRRQAAANTVVRLESKSK
ncbi:MAG: hypothetical protein K2M12_01050, partial [Muribaculaceae bacterium]|nr:hypothetical protein [Muribaculaceae bacterium]